MFKRILVAYAGSEPAGRAFEMALDPATKHAAALRVVAVARPPEFGGEVETRAELERSLKHSRHILKPIKDRAAGAGLAIEVDAVIGHPAERIVIEGEKWAADLIVVGHRGHGLMGRWLLGSIAKQVMHHANCAVLVAR